MIKESNKITKDKMASNIVNVRNLDLCENDTLLCKRNNTDDEKKNALIKYQMIKYFESAFSDEDI